MPGAHHLKPEPVFVDGSGRRRRLARILGAGLAAGLMASLAMLLAGLFGSSPLHLPMLPDLGRPEVQTRTPQPGPASPAVPGSGPIRSPASTATGTQPSVPSSSLPSHGNAPTAPPGLGRPRPSKSPR